MDIHIYKPRLFIGAKRHACFTILKNYFYYTKHITRKFIFLAFRVSAYFLEIFTFKIIYDNSKKYALFFRMYVQLYVRKLIRYSPCVSSVVKGTSYIQILHNRTKFFRYQYVHGTRIVILYLFLYIRI